MTETELFLLSLYVYCTERLLYPILELATYKHVQNVVGFVLVAAYCG